MANAQNSVFGPTGYTLGNGLNGVTQYDALGRSSGISLCANSTAFGCSGGTQAYQMTQSVAGGRVTAMNDTILGTNATPSYDEFNRLSGISYGTRQQAFSYVYDRYGNRWFQNITQGSGPSAQLSFNPANNQLNAAGYSYDVAGNMVSDGSHSYTYDAEGNVVAMDGGATTYIYDAFNHRVRVTKSSLDTYYTFNIDGQRVASWNATSATPTMLAAYAYWNGRPIATYTSAAVTYSHQDLLGTKRLSTTYTGSVLGSYQSLPFGDGYASSGTDSDPSHFALLDHDAESGTDHAQARQYNSTPGTWMSPDPYDGSYSFGDPQTLNRYTYASNNPLAYVDPSGQFDCSAYNSSADAAALAQCEQALGLASAAAGPNCSTTISAACSSAPTNPTLEGENAIAAYESYSLYEGDRAEAEYVSRVDEVYWEDQAILQNAASSGGGSNQSCLAQQIVNAIPGATPTGTNGSQGGHQEFGITVSGASLLMAGFTPYTSPFGNGNGYRSPNSSIHVNGTGGGVFSNISTVSYGGEVAVQAHFDIGNASLGFGGLLEHALVDVGLGTLLGWIPGLHNFLDPSC